MKEKSLFEGMSENNKGKWRNIERNGVDGAGRREKTRGISRGGGKIKMESAGIMPGGNQCPSSALRPGLCVTKSPEMRTRNKLAPDRPSAHNLVFMRINPFLRSPLPLACLLASLTAAGAQTPAVPTAEKTAASAAEKAPAASTDGFTPLFDGKTLAGWTNPYTFGEAIVVDGEIQLTSTNKFFLTTEKSYTDFIFEGDVHLPEGKANSGFMFRAIIKEQPGKNTKSVVGYQAEVDGDAKRGWSGGLYDEGLRGWFISPIKGDAASEAAFKTRSAGAFKRNDWNTYRITCQGSKIKIEVNGVTTTDVTDDRTPSGPIAIQHHGEAGATYRFRNLRIKELKK